jgi:hypothetical protein
MAVQLGAGIDEAQPPCHAVAQFIGLTKEEVALMGREQRQGIVRLLQQDRLPMPDSLL